MKVSWASSGLAGTAIVTLMMLLAAPLSARAAEFPGEEAGTRGQGNAWSQSLQQIKKQALQAPGVRSAKAQIEAGQAKVSSARSDMGLSVNANTQYYPGGIGTNGGDRIGFTNLKQRAEIRLQWDILDFIARRGGRINQAKAKRHLAKAEARQAHLEAASQLVDEAVCGWALERRQEALSNALKETRQALQHARTAQQEVPSASLTRQAEQGIQRAARIKGRVERQVTGLRECRGRAPELPDAYTALPTHPPKATSVERLAVDDPRVAKLEAQAAVHEGRSASLTATGIRVRLHSGYVALRRAQATRTGPKFGASITVPLGSLQNDDKAAAKWQARSASLRSAAMLEKRRRQLQELLQKWAQATAQMRSTGDRLQLDSDRLKKLELRASHETKNTPEPWEVELQRAEVWLEVDRMWQARRLWLQSLLTWALSAPEVLQKPGSRTGATGQGLCAPLPRCPTETGSNYE